MQRSTVFFLVLLRFAIGWHFLVEGYQKIPASYLAAWGLQGSNKSFSSAGYFREAPGPLGSAVRWAAGDPDDEALGRLVVKPLPEGKDPATYEPYLRMPPGLDREWKDYLAQFSKHYALDAEQQKAAEAALEQSGSRVVNWLSYLPPGDAAARDKDPNYADNTSEQTRTYTSGEVKKRMSMAERIEEYRSKVTELRDASGRKLWVFGKDVEGLRLRQDKAEVARLRAGLLADLQKQTQAYEQTLEKLLSKSQKDGEGLQPAPNSGVVAWIDFVTPWMLTGIGACLMIGLFSRVSAFLAAGFLFMTYLAVPSLPWLPAPPASEGNYLFVNKNVIEMLALCALATLPTGRWFGLDAILHVFGRLFAGKKTRSA